MLQEYVCNLRAVQQNTVTRAGEMLRKEVMRNQIDTVITELLIAYAQKRNNKVYVIQEIFMFVQRVKLDREVVPPKFKIIRL